MWKVTRNDNLSRQMKTHSNPIYKTMKEIKEEQQISPSNCEDDSLPEQLNESVKEEMLRRNEDYLEKMDIGRQVYEVLQGAVKYCS